MTSLRALENAGVWLRINDRTLLIDALQGGYAQYPASGAETVAMDADALLFTHKHPDHFHARMVWDYLQTHAACRVYAPSEAAAALAALGEAARVYTLRPFASVALGPGLTLTPLPTRHMGAEYRRKEHFSLLLEGEKRVLIAGDAAPVFNNFLGAQGTGVGQVDLLIAPYPYTIYEPAQRMFGRYIQADELAANHFPEPDTERLRAQVAAVDPETRSYKIRVLQPGAPALLYK